VNYGPCGVIELSTLQLSLEDAPLETFFSAVLPLAWACLLLSIASFGHLWTGCAVLVCAWVWLDVCSLALSRSLSS